MRVSFYDVTLTRFPTVVNGPRSRRHKVFNQRPAPLERGHVQVLSDQCSRFFSKNLKGTSGRSACAAASSDDHFVGAGGGTTPNDADDTGWCRSGSEFDGFSMLDVPSASGVDPEATPPVPVEAP